MTRDRVPLIAAMLAAAAPSKRQASQALDKLVPLELDGNRAPPADSAPTDSASAGQHAEVRP